jgi:hypothetical protein
MDPGSAAHRFVLRSIRGHAFLILRREPPLASLEG